MFVVIEFARGLGPTWVQWGKKTLSASMFLNLGVLYLRILEKYISGDLDAHLHACQKLLRGKITLH